MVTPVTEAMGHTVVLSRAELGSILEQQEKRSGAARVVSLPGSAPEGRPVPAKRSAPAWIGVLVGVLVGLLIGAAVLWLMLQRPALS